ncbi:unnamed protein product, partial [Ectocarpus sp. 12 AP-2014]
ASTAAAAGCGSGATAARAVSGSLDGGVTAAAAAFVPGFSTSGAVPPGQSAPPAVVACGSAAAAAAAVALTKGLSSDSSCFTSLDRGNGISQGTLPSSSSCFTAVRLTGSSPLQPPGRLDSPSSPNIDLASGEN